MEATLNLPELDSVLVRAAHLGAREALAEQAEKTPWMSVKSTAEYLDTSPAAVRALVKRSQVPFHRVNGRILFARDELDAYVRGEWSG